MKEILLIIAISFMIASVVSAVDLPQQVLEPGDVEHFLKTFRLIEKDFENFGVKHNVHDGTLTVPESIEAKNQLLEIFKKHGWGEEFFQKAGVILMGYSSIEYGRQVKTTDSEIEKSLKELESNPNLSAEMKKQLKEQMMMAKKMMATQDTTFKENIHPADRQMIMSHISELKKVLEEEHKNEPGHDSTPTSGISDSVNEQVVSELAEKI
jgi:hypothetical protein